MTVVDISCILVLTATDNHYQNKKKQLRKNEEIKMKMNNKTTKTEMMNYLMKKEHQLRYYDKALAEMIRNANTVFALDEKKVKKVDLRNMVIELDKVLDAVEEKKLKLKPVASIKKESPKKVIKKKVKKAEPKVEVEKEEKPKENKIKILKTKSKKSTTMVDCFPQELNLEGDGLYELVPEIKSLDDLANAVEKGNNSQDYIFAVYWTRRHLRQFPYFSAELETPTVFPHDLDIARCAIISDTKKVIYALSDYTDALYTFFPRVFPEYDGVRLVDGMEFQIYKLKKAEDK